MAPPAQPRAGAVPPGPRGVPWLGPLLSLRADPLNFLRRCEREYGPVVRLAIGHVSVYLLTEPELIEQVLVAQHAACTKDMVAQSMRIVLGDGLLTSEGALWKRQRRTLAPALGPKSVRRHIPDMVAATRALCDRLPESGLHDILADMGELSVVVVSKALFGVEGREDTALVARVSRAVSQWAERELWSGTALLPSWVPTRERWALRKATSELDAVVERTIEALRTRAEPARHWLAELVEARDELGQPLTLRELRDHAATMLLAGHETTALTLAYAAYSLAQQPRIGEALRAELDAALGTRPVTAEDLPRLPSLDAVVRETLRLYPAAPILGREIIEPFELGGYLLPKGSQLAFSPYLMQRDPRWYQDPERFWPERWRSARSDSLPRFAYFPYGGGARVCIGQYFATQQIALALATMVREVDFAPAPDFVLELMPALMLRPVGGRLPLRVTRRRAPS